MGTYKNYREGSPSELGGVIEKIISINEYIAIYIADDGTLGCEYDENNVIPEYGTVREEYKRLVSKIPSDTPPDVKKKVQRQLGSSMFSALSCDNIEDAINCFSHVEKSLKHARSAENAVITFILSSILVSVFFIIIFAFVYYFVGENELRKVSLASIAGISGSLFSSLQNKKNIKFDLFSTNWLYIAQALIQSLIGLLSGIALYAVINSEIVFAIDKNNLNILFFMAFMSGFSERFIDDLFSKAEKQKIAVPCQ